MARIDPLTVNELDEDLKSEVEKYAVHPGYVPNSFLTLAHKPKIARAYRNLQMAINESITFDPGLRAMMWHMMSHTDGNLFCEAHSIHAVAWAGLASDEQLAEIWSFETSSLFSEAERAALRFARTVGTDPKSVTDEDIDELREHFSDEHILEMVAAMSFGSWLLCWNNTLMTDVEEMPLESAGRILGPQGWRAEA